MKKIILVAAVAVILAMSFASCRSSRPVCPAYRSHIVVEQPVNKV